MSPSAGLPLLRPGTPVLVRPDNRVHIGADPHHSLIVDVPEPVRADEVAALLRSLSTPQRPADVARRAARIGLSPDDLTLLLERLALSGKALLHNTSGDTPLRVRIHGRGPLGDLLADSLADARVVVTRSSSRPTGPNGVRQWDANLVILTDYLVHDPAIVGALTDARIPHLPIAVRDGTGMIGPLVLPGLTSCLRCADLHRTGLDPEWPLLAAQLVRCPSSGSPGTIRCTAALAHAQIEQLTTALGSATGPRDPSPRPQLLDRTLELRAAPAELSIVDRPPHPTCGCRWPATGPGCARPQQSVSTLPIS